MNDQEKLAHLKEQVADTWDQIVKDRYVLNEKANECMQCFTAAGTIKSEDQYEVLASTIKQRYHNLQDFEIFHREYKQLLDQFNQLHEQLLAVRARYAEQMQGMEQPQPVE
jgi:DNA repair ATPase RecN